MSYDRNPRFPHTLSVRRPRQVDGEYVLDDEGNIVYDTVPLDLVATSDGWAIKNSEGRMVIEKTVDSISFGYRTSTRNLSEMNAVVNYNVTIHTPPFTTPLLYGDVLVLTDYERTYTAKMVKKVTFNWGTNIWFDESKN